MHLKKKWGAGANQIVMLQCSTPVRTLHPCIVQCIQDLIFQSLNLCYKCNQTIECHIGLKTRENWWTYLEANEKKFH
jgi:hypothetical protein